jgi:hypothetical protein
VREILIDPLSRRVDGVMLTQGKFPSLWTVVPPSACVKSDPSFLYVDLSEQEFRTLPFGVTDRPAMAGLSSWALDRRTPVASVWKDRLGSAAGVRFNPETGEISHIILRSGWLFPVHTWLPMEAMSAGTGGSILTSLSREDVRSATEAGAPRAASQIVRSAEGRMLFQRWRAVPAGVISISYASRRLLLEGSMRNKRDRLAVEDLARGVHNVLGIENRITVEPLEQPPLELPSRTAASPAASERRAA